MTTIICSGCIDSHENDNSNDTYSLVNVGDSIPDFSVKLSGGTTCTNAMLKNNVSVIVFFNTDCPDCQKELSIINAAYESFKSNADFKIIAIAREENADSIKNYWQSHDLSIPYSPQKDKTIYSKFATQRIPRIYISNKENKVTSKFFDEEMPTISTLESAIKAAYKE
jgi:peroxiredoxin